MIALVALADSVFGNSLIPVPHVVSSIGGRYFALVDPREDASNGLTCYRVSEDDGHFFAEWAIKRFRYPEQETLLSRDGKTLIRVLNVRLSELRDDPPFVEIYRSGKLTKVLKVSKFMNLASIKPSDVRVNMARITHPYLKDAISLVDSTDAGRILEDNGKGKGLSIKEGMECLLLVTDAADRYIVGLDSGMIISAGQDERLLPIKDPHPPFK